MMKKLIVMMVFLLACLCIWAETTEIKLTSNVPDGTGNNEGADATNGGLGLWIGYSDESLGWEGSSDSLISVFDNTSSIERTVVGEDGTYGSFDVYIAAQTNNSEETQLAVSLGLPEGATGWTHASADVDPIEITFSADTPTQSQDASVYCTKSGTGNDTLVVHAVANTKTEAPELIGKISAMWKLSDSYQAGDWNATIVLTVSSDLN